MMILTALRQEAIQLIEQIPEEQMPTVIQYMKILKSNALKKEQFSHPGETLTSEMKAFLELEQMLFPIQNELDYEKELAEARQEKYGYLD
ncbi:MAG: hypothetical protein NC180_02675 [Muribaculaceae bacterium]|nr:hypothetical protein [Roseburia sp.]MCM1432090.1 hypothetical protein [Muribaculaceae bacterium]MCM1492110.1 hypothetical protein [Muribaculaceae bacterium]